LILPVSTLPCLILSAKVNRLVCRQSDLSPEHIQDAKRPVIALSSRTQRKLTIIPTPYTLYLITLVEYQALFKTPITHHPAHVTPNAPPSGSTPVLSSYLPHAPRRHPHKSASSDPVHPIPSLPTSHHPPQSFLNHPENQQPTRPRSGLSSDKETNVPGYSE
jgi:hypothetical protein